MKKPPLARTLGAWLLVTAVAAPAAAQVQLQTREPRAFGWQVGDMVSRTVVLDVPPGLVLDEASVPQPGARGNALELRSVARQRSGGGRHHELTLSYQVFLSPREPRILEMPAFTLRLQGQPRGEEVRVEVWPLGVSPLVPVEVSYRHGLGELQPDVAPPLLDTGPGRMRLVAYGVLALALLAYLAHVYIGLPWWNRRHRPFTRAWRGLRTLTPASPDTQWREAFKRIHGALNQTLGEVAFEQDIDRLLQARPQFAPLRGELATFFQQSRREFFGAGAARADRVWLLAFCRRCRDAERGSA